MGEQSKSNNKQYSKKLLPKSAMQRSVFIFWPNLFMEGNCLKYYSVRWLVYMPSIVRTILLLLPKTSIQRSLIPVALCSVRQCRWALLLAVTERCMCGQFLNNVNILALHQFVTKGAKWFSHVFMLTSLWKRF